MLLRNAVLSGPESTYKSFSEIFLLKFPISIDFNSKFDVYDSFCSFNSWKFGSLLICRLTFCLSLSCSEWGWCWTVLFSCRSWCLYHCCCCFCCCRSFFNYFCCCWSGHIYPYIRDKIITYLWYTDDLFFIWKGIEQERLSFIEILNKKHLSITFNFK